VNAVYYNKIQAVPAGPERDALVTRLRDEYRADVDLQKLASEMVVDAVVPSGELRREVARRFERYAGKREDRPRKRHMVPPV
jgi:methylmalonyl-CoA decarboxylase subunit alpha